MHWLQIDVSDLAGRYDATREIESSGPVEGFRSGLGWIEDGDSVHVKLQLRSVTDRSDRRGLGEAASELFQVPG
jgi:hypothetical protein